MKQRMIVIAGVVLLVLLIVRMFFVLWDRGQESQREFVSKLGYDLAARIDSIGLFSSRAPVGFLYASITRGEFEYNEKKVNRKLQKRRNFQFLVPYKDDRIEIFTKGVREYQVGDSLVINSENDQVLVFRAGKKIREYAISENLRGGNQ